MKEIIEKALYLGFINHNGILIKDDFLISIIDDDFVYNRMTLVNNKTKNCKKIHNSEELEKTINI